VLGVDVNDEMLSLARCAAPDVAERIGYANVEFLRGRIQDLALPLDRLDKWLANHPVQSAADLASLDSQVSRLRGEEPLVPDASIDIVISNCVLNLVHSDQKRQLIEEIYRVLVRGGRIAISDIVSDEDIPQEMRDDPELWSGCISGAFKEDELLVELERAGFYGIRVDVWSEDPFQVVDGIEFRSVTVTAHKGLEGPCFEGLQGVIYRGPWSEVQDDDGHVLRRGERTAVCEKTFEILSGEPYTDSIIPIPARVEIPEHERREFDCSRTAPRHPRETKGAGYTLTTEASSGCEPGDSCC
jgi:SAM-dependent methyltransferase